MIKEELKKPRLIVFYLPQFHPIPENDKVWGTGFTEWTNVGKAKPLFFGHEQPKIPADLGYYDLRLSESRNAQAELAKKYGIEGFCYWHYWFGDGKRLLERPFNEVLNSKEPDFPFCLSWANHSWKTSTWNPKGSMKEIIQEMNYPGKQDIIDHFMVLLPAFKDKRYIRVNNKMLFGIYNVRDMSDPALFIETWNKLAREHGLEGFYFFTFEYKRKNHEMSLDCGVDAVVYDIMMEAMVKTFSGRFKYLFISRLLHLPQMVSYSLYIKYFLSKIPVSNQVLPCVIPNWDNTPRAGRKGKILTKSSPEKWNKLLKSLFKKISSKKGDDNIVFIKSWNEWAEGNYLEPDLKNGSGYLVSLKNAIDNLQF